MPQLSFGLCRELVELYDEVFDSFDQQEVAFTHACIRALTRYRESAYDEQKEELTDLLNGYQETLMTEAAQASTELFDREILLDDTTHQWLTRVSKEYEPSEALSDSAMIEMMFMTGVIMVAIMQDIVEEKPSASLSVFPVGAVSFAQILNGRPQSLN